MAEEEVTTEVEEKSGVSRSTVLKGAAIAGASLMAGGVLAACSASDDGGSDGGGGGDTASGGGGGGEDFVIGALYPLTGANAADGEQMNNGAQLAVDEINAAGGIAGRMIKFEVLDTDLAAPEIIQQNYQKLADQKVDAETRSWRPSTATCSRGTPRWTRPPATARRS